MPRDLESLFFKLHPFNHPGINPSVVRKLNVASNHILQWCDDPRDATAAQVQYDQHILIVLAMPETVLIMWFLEWCEALDLWR